jgi:hypothetical protein
VLPHTVRSAYYQSPFRETVRSTTWRGVAKLKPGVWIYKVVQMACQICQRSNSATVVAALVHRLRMEINSHPGLLFHTRLYFLLDYPSSTD